MIRKIKINNYKLFKDFTLELDCGVNLICGPNGSSKSALLEAMYAMKNFLAMPEYSDKPTWMIDEAFPFNTLCRWSVKESGYEDMTFTVELDGHTNEIFCYELCVRYNFSEKKIRIQKEFLTLNDTAIFTFTEGKIEVQTDDKKKLSFNGDWRLSGLVMASRNNSKLRLFGKLFSEIFPLHLMPPMFKQDFEEHAETLDMFGVDFPAWYFGRFNSQSKNLVKLVEDGKNFIPGLVGINNIKKGSGYRLCAQVEYNKKSYNLELNELSDGQKALLALYSILINIPDKAVLFIDEPENFLATGEIQPWINAIYDAWADRDMQIIVISHNAETLKWYRQSAIIFSLEGEPPYVKSARHTEDENSSSLQHKLKDMEWANQCRN